MSIQRYEPWASAAAASMRRCPKQTSSSMSRPSCVGLTLSSPSISAALICSSSSM